MGAAEAAIPPGGVQAKCSTCGAACTMVRTQVDGATVEEVEIEEFNRRAEGKAPPRNYG